MTTVMPQDAEPRSPGPQPVVQPSVATGPPPAPAPAPGSGPLAWFEARLSAAPHALAVVAEGVHWSYRDLDAAADALIGAMRREVEPGDVVGVCLDRSPGLVAAVVALARLGAVYLPLGAAPGAARLNAVADSAGIRHLLAGDALRPPEGWTDTPVTRGPLALEPVAGITLLSRTNESDRASSQVQVQVQAHADAQTQTAASASAVSAVSAVSAASAASAASNAASTSSPSPAPFYAVTTSGTTGTPKIVLVDQPALANGVAWYCHRLGLGPASRVSLMIESTFDPHLLELWSALSAGASLHVPPAGVQFSALDLEHWWRGSAVTHCILPTPLAELVFARPWPEGVALRHVTVGGDRMRTRPPRNCTAAVDNMYGPAEATVVATAYRVSDGEPSAESAAPPGPAVPAVPAAPLSPTVQATLPAVPGERGGESPIPIGEPISGVTVVVTDEEGHVRPRGEAGELCIGGAGLALGYSDPRRTAERFVPPPQQLGASAVQRLYRTGDKVLMRPDGVLEFLGRLDDQVKISGVRIEPGEVEAALEAHPAVSRAVVVPVTANGTGPGNVGVMRLAAFVVPAPGEQPDERSILATARSRLLEQAVPAVIRIVGDLPLTAHGKVDRAALAATLARVPALPPAPTSPTADTDTEADTQTETEEHLVALCRHLLGQPELTADDSFTAAGGTSLSAARLLAAVEETYQIRIRAAELLRQPTLRALAALVDSKRPK